MFSDLFGGTVSEFSSLKMWCICGIFIMILLAESQGLPTYRCSLCKPGYHALTNCTEDRDTLCTSCPEGSFKHQYNSDNECNPCSQCGVGLFVLKECSRTSDVFCESCASKTHKHLKTYLEFCLGFDAEVANMQADGTFVNEDELKININTKKENQADTSKHKPSSIHHPKKSEKTAPLENLVVLPEDEAKKDNLLPVFSTKEPIETDVNSLYEYKEISITDNFEGSGEGSGENVLIQKTPLSEELPSSGEGEIILKDNGENNDSIETVVVFGSNKFRTVPPGEEGEEEDEEIFVVSPDNESGSEELHTAAIDNRTRAAIIIGVAVGSVVFFTVGFFVSRHYRRKRSLRISEKTPSQNHVNGSKDGIEFQDMSSKSKIYTAPEMSNKNGSYKKLDGGNIEDLYATTLKKDARSRSGSEQDKHVNGIDKIKFIDDTEEEGNGASDRLLSTEDHQDHSTSLSDVVLDKLEQRLSPIDEEKAPMLPK